MTVSGTFTVSDFVPTDWVPEITTALAVGHLHMVKTYAGEVTGRSITQFSSAFDQAAGIGAYVALESFEGSIGDRAGTLNFLHAASTNGADRSDEYGLVVAGSGTGDLAGATGTVALQVDADGTHRMTFDLTDRP